MRLKPSAFTFRPFLAYLCMENRGLMGADDALQAILLAEGLRDIRP